MDRVADGSDSGVKVESAGVLGGDPPTSYFANREVLEAIVGHPIPPDVWEFVPWGHRLVVVREDAADVSPGGIIIPSTAKPQYTRGWVVSAGHQVGWESPHFPNTCPLPPWALVGRKVMFGNFAGTALQPDTEFGPRGTHTGKYVILSDADLFGELIDPNNTKESST